MWELRIEGYHRLYFQSYSAGLRRLIQKDKIKVVTNYDPKVTRLASGFSFGINYLMELSCSTL